MKMRPKSVSTALHPSELSDREKRQLIKALAQKASSASDLEDRISNLLETHKLLINERS